MKVFNHHIYEYKKGLRSLVLHTLPSEEKEGAEERLRQNGIPYHMRRVNEKKINVFFGEEECVKIVESFGDKPLNELSCEEDFILGTMLGYSRLLQCRRYLERRKTSSLKRVI